MRQISLDRHKKFKSTSEIHVSQICSIHLKTSLCGTELPWEEFLTRSGFALCWKIVLTNSSTVLVRSMMFPIEILEECFKKSRIQESPTFSTDADSRTDTILERLRDLSAPKSRDHRSAPQNGLGPRENADSVQSAGTHPRF